MTLYVKKSTNEIVREKVTIETTRRKPPMRLNGKKVLVRFASTCLSVLIALTVLLLVLLGIQSQDKYGDFRAQIDKISNQLRELRVPDSSQVYRPVFSNSTPGSHDDHWKPPLSREPSPDCPRLRVRPSPVETGQFQVVVKHKIYVYSAFLDKDVVRVISLVPRKDFRRSLTCLLWFSDDRREQALVTPARVERIPENHERKFTAAYITCPLPPEGSSRAPRAVSLAEGSACDLALNLVPVTQPEQVTSEFTVCVTPLNFRYDQARELVEMIEMNRLLGSDQLVFYNHSTGPHVDKVLELYSRQGLVQVHPWHPPVQTDSLPPSSTKPEIHYFGQLAALNDCLHRYRHTSQYLVYTDLDEFIIPVQENNWGQLLHQRETQRGQQAVFMFRCVFFRKEWPSPAKQFSTEASKFRSVLLAYTLRETRFFLPNMRSKMILNPRLVGTVGVHFPWSTSGPADEVPPEVARLHHYRNWEQPDDPQPRLADELLVEKFGPRLVDSLNRTWAQLGNILVDTIS